MSVRPRRVAHRGRVCAHGYHLPELAAGREQLQRRVLSLWRPGARVAEVEDGLVLLLPEPVWTDAAQAPGTPLVKMGSRFLAAPFEDDEIEALERSEGIVLVRGGTAVVETVSTWSDPSRWLALDGWTGAELGSLGARVPAPEAAIPPAKTINVRHAFSIPSRSLEADTAITEIRERLARRATSAEPTSGSGSLLRSIVGWLSRRTQGRSGPVGARGPVRSTPWSRLAARLNAALVRFLVQTGVASAIGRRQAKYLARLNDLFESGDLEQALREAIPLGGEASPDTRISLGLPPPRTNLALQPHRTHASSTMRLSDDYFGHLRERYRAAARQLEQRGQIEQAAFVLSDLLHDDEAAVALLEKHGRLRVAAELAEGRGLSPGIVIRQWFLAGDIDRAVVIARRTGAFADAVLRLERTHSKHAETLRLQWADALAEAGLYAAAVRTLWPVTSARRLAAHWVDRGIELGGEIEAALIPLKLEVSPEAADEVVQRARRILQNPSREASSWRSALGEALLQSKSEAPARRALLRLCARALVADESTVRSRAVRERVKRLVESSGDAILRADFAATKAPRQPPKVEPSAASFRWAREDVGPLRCSNVAVLPDGRVLIALGDAGARLLTPDGRTVKTFDVPAYALVVSDAGHQALALAPRGESWLVSRLDLQTLGTHGFGLLRATEWARSYGEGMWFIVDGASVMALDVHAERLRAIWSVDVGQGIVAHLDRTPSELQFLCIPPSTPLESAPRPERWCYQYPGAVLRSRTTVPDDLWGDSDSSIFLAPQGMWGCTRAPREDVVQISLGSKSVELHGSVAYLPRFDGRWLTVLLEIASGRELVVLDDRLEPRFRLVLEGSEVVASRIRGDSLCVADEKGRVGVFDLEHGIALSSLRPT
ncbi:MAG: bpX6 domain-containing protein [Myxococcaceae bacterium]